MTAGDCLQLGRQAYLIGEDQIAMTWMEESLRKYHQENENDKTARLQDILKYYAFSSLEEGIMLTYYNPYNICKMYNCCHFY